MKNKTTHVCDLIISQRLDILVLIESWQTGDKRDNIAIADIKATLPGYEICSEPRIGRRGGGICVIYRREFEIKVNDAPHRKTFECLDLLFTSTDHSQFRLITIYRPGRSCNPKSVL
jgi:hypothetical protein